MTEVATPSESRASLYGRGMVAVLVIGLALRALILSQTANLGLKIADEHQYAELAGSLLDGHGLAWATGDLTSLRPPLYPALVAAVWRVAGAGNLQAVRLVQCLLALITAALVYALGRRAFTPAVGAIGAATVWLYPSLVVLNFTILSETLFTLLLVAFVLLTVMLVQHGRVWTAVACGLALGLGALTRSVLWPVPLLLCPLLMLILGGSFGQRLLLSGLVLAGYALVVAPWAIRNTRLQGVVTIVDTMGGMNLRMGNYEYTPEDRMWDAVSLKGEESWVYALSQELARSGSTGVGFTEGMKDKWAQRKAIEYIESHPGTTLRRAAIKFGDFWGLERSYLAGVQQGLYAPPTWFVVVAAFLILLSEAGLMLLGAAGLVLAIPAWRVHVLLLLPVVVITGVHTIVFGHSRYHLPLVPILSIYAAALVASRFERARRAATPARIGAASLVLVLLAIWIRQIVVVDAERVLAFLRRLW